MVPAAIDGLYDSRFEHDACGVGFVADLAAKGGHDVVASALRVLCNLEHRGARGADPDTGDGAGILTQIPDDFFRAVADFPLPDSGAYAAGLAFLPTDYPERAVATAKIAELAADEGLTVLGWREVPVKVDACGAGARKALPHLAQLFVAGVAGESGMHLERMAFCLRKRIDHEAGVYFASLSSRTIVYKGMLSAPQVEPFFPDLSDERYQSNLALVHSRFSTNTFPSWERAHPYRYIAHNGEINTVQGNRNWMRAREAMLASTLIPGSTGGRGIDRLFPIVHPKGSDSGSFDECLELLHLGGPVAAARAADDDSRAVGEPRGDGRGAARVLRLPRHADGAVGRPRADRVHRRHRDRRRARPQWPAARPVLGHQRRSCHPRQRGRRARHRPRPGGTPRPAAAGPDLPRRHRGRPDRRRRGGQGRTRRPAPLRGLAARRPGPPGRPASQGSGGRGGWRGGKRPRGLADGAAPRGTC